MQKTILRTVLALILCGVLFIGVPAVFAFEIPPQGNPTFIQTNGPLVPIERGDWYTSPDNGIRAGYHYFTIYIPCGWPNNLDIHIDLFSPGLSNAAGTADELDNLPPGNGVFELYAPPTQVGPITAPDIPGPGAPGSIFSQTYLPDSGEIWHRFYTFPGGTYDCTGPYVLRAETTGPSENAWRVRIGYDLDNDPNNAPPPNNSDPDGIPGTDDEITVGVARTSYQHDQLNQIVCLTLYQYVEPFATEAIFQNFDMDLNPVADNARITYYAPSDVYDPTGLVGGTPGTASGFTEWNNSGGVNRGPGDVILNPESGWWRIVACVNYKNQYSVEGEFYQQPPTPRMIVEKDDGRVNVARNEILTYVLTFRNISDTMPAPGAARNVVLTDTLPPEVVYQPGTCVINPPYTGTCDFIDNPGVNNDQIIYRIDGAVNAGATGSVTFDAQVRDTVLPPEDIENIVVLDYTDSAGRPFPPETDNDIDLVAEPLMQVVKDDGRVEVAPGDVLTYGIDFANISNTTPTPDTAYNITLTDTLPPNTTYLSCAFTLPLTGTCAADGQGRAVFTINQPLAPGETGRVELNVRVNDNATDPQYNLQVYNTVDLAYTDIANIPQPIISDDDLDILNQQPSLAPLMTVQKDDWKEDVEKGERLTYRIDFANISNTTPTPGTAYQVVLTDEVPRNTTYQSCEILPPYTGACDTPDGGSTVIFRLNEPVNPGEGGRVLMTVDVAPWADADEYGLRVINWVHLDYVDASGNPRPRVSDDDVDVLRLPITVPGEINIVKRANPPFALPGDTVTWTVIVSNATKVAIRNVVVTDVVPSELEILGVSATAGAVSLNGQTVTWEKDPVNAGEIITITVITRVRDSVSVPFSILNVANLTGDGVPPKTGRDRILSVGRLPETGESPWGLLHDLIDLRMVLILAVSSLVLLVGGIYRRARGQAQV